MSLSSERKIAPRFLVLAERQVQTALEQLGFDGVMREAIEILRGAEARQRLHVVALVEVEQHVAPVQVLHDLRRADQRLLFLRLAARSSGPGRQRQRASDGGEQQPPRPALRSKWRIVPVISLPFLDDEFRLRLDRAVADLQLDVLRADALVSLMVAPRR